MTIEPWYDDPYDDYYDDGEEYCDHSEYEVDWEGRATCDFCRHTWWLTFEEHERYRHMEARWMAEYDRMMRREHSRFWRTIRWLRSHLPVVGRTVRKSDTGQCVDDIPF